MPKMGDGMEEGTLLGWTKKEGEKVKSGEIIGSIQTDKATLDLEAPTSGALVGYLIQAGETVPVGKPIAAILKEGESLPEGWGTSKNTGSERTTEATPVAIVSPGNVAAPTVESPSTPLTSAEEPIQSDRPKASPLARRVAKELGIDLRQVTGSGPGGRIVERDVLASNETPIASDRAIKVASAEDVRVPLNKLRQITAQRTQQAKQQAPHFYVTVEVAVDRIAVLREQFESEDSGKVSVNDFVLAASVRALQDMPEVNASFDGDAVLRYGSIHLGFAAAVDEGLLVPVIKNSQGLTLRQLSAAARELVHKAREGKLHPDEMAGSTFTISNMGMLNVDNFAAIINTPNAAIIAVSTARKKLVVNDEDEAELSLRMNVTGSFDHRVVDGAIGAKFMNVLRDYLENPTRLLS